MTDDNCNPITSNPATPMIPHATSRISARQQQGFPTALFALGSLLFNLSQSLTERYHQRGRQTYLSPLLRPPYDPRLSAAWIQRPLLKRRAMLPNTQLPRHHGYRPLFLPWPRAFTRRDSRHYRRNKMPDRTILTAFTEDKWYVEIHHPAWRRKPTLPTLPCHWVSQATAW